MGLDIYKTKRLEWVQQNKYMSFGDVIYMDESTVQIKTHHCTCYYKRGQKPRYKPKLKTPCSCWKDSYKGRKMFSAKTSRDLGIVP